MWIVIDGYNKEVYDQNNYLDKIINLAKNNKKRLLICIIGEGEYINKKQYQYFSNQDIDFSALYWNLLIENDTSKQNGILKSPKYYYKYRYSKETDNFEDIVKKNLTEKFMKIKINSFFY